MEPLVYPDCPILLKGRNDFDDSRALNEVNAKASAGMPMEQWNNGNKVSHGTLCLLE